MESQPVPCIQMKELEASCSRYAERRREMIPLSVERRKASPGKRRFGQAQMAYIIQMHLQNCSECRGAI
jgi:hypothetical protein